MERNRPRYEGNYSRGRTHGGRFRSGRANLNQPNYNYQQQDEGVTDKFPSYAQQSPNSSFPRQRNNLRPSSSYQNSGESQGPSNNFINNSNRYRGQGHGKPHIASLDTSAALTNTDLEEKDSQYGPFLTGTCPDMCPAKERSQREKLRDLAVFERLDGNPHKTSAKLAVKKLQGMSDNVLALCMVIRSLVCVHDLSGAGSLFSYEQFGSFLILSCMSSISFHKKLEDVASITKALLFVSNSLRENPPRDRDLRPASRSGVTFGHGD